MKRPTKPRDSLSCYQTINANGETVSLSDLSKEELINELAMAYDLFDDIYDALNDRFIGELVSAKKKLKAFI